MDRKTLAYVLSGQKSPKRNYRLLITVLLCLIPVILTTTFIAGYLYAVKSAKPINKHAIEFNGQIHKY